MMRKTLNKISIILLLLLAGVMIISTASAESPIVTGAVPLTSPTAKCLATDPLPTSYAPNASYYTGLIQGIWQGKGWSADTLLQSSCTPANVENYWNNDATLKYYNNMGHGCTLTNNPPFACIGLDFWPNDYPNGTVGFIPNSWIQAAVPAYGLDNLYAFVDSCYSFTGNTPNAFLYHDSVEGMYIGANTQIDDTAAPKCSYLFWYDALDLGQSPQTALNNAMAATGMTNDFSMDWVG